MPLTDDEIKQLYAAGASEDEILEVAKAKHGQMTQAPAPPDQAAYGGARTAENLAKGAALVGSIGAPVASIAAGAPALPVLGGLAGAVGAGAATNYALEKLGITPALKGAAAKLREGATEYNSPSVLWNLMGYAGDEMMPKQALANVLEAAPALAEAYVATKGGALGGTLGAKGFRAVPQGSEPQALARTLTKGGLPVAEPVGVKPRDVIAPFAEAKGAAGAAVGAAKQAALETSKTAPEVIQAVREAAKGGLVKAGVPVVEGRLNPTLATEGAAPAEAVLGRLGDLGHIPEEATGAEAMRLSNNVLEGLKKIVSDSKVKGTGLAGRTSKSAISAWQKAIDDLGPQDKVAVAKSADKAFSKLADIVKMVEKSSSTQVGQAPSFNPRKFVSMWETMPAPMRAKFSPDEVALLDGLLTQRPSIPQQVLREAATRVKALGWSGLKFTPQTRFYEPRGKAPAGSYIPAAVGSTAFTKQLFTPKENQQ